MLFIIQRCLVSGKIKMTSVKKMYEINQESVKANLNAIRHLIHPVKSVSPDCNRDCRNRVQESTRLRQAANDKYFKRLEFNFVKN